MRRNLRLDWRALALLGALLSIIIDWPGLVYAMPTILPPMAVQTAKAAPIDTLNVIKNDHLLNFFPAKQQASNPVTDIQQDNKIKNEFTHNQQLKNEHLNSLSTPHTLVTATAQETKQQPQTEQQQQRLTTLNEKQQQVNEHLNSISVKQLNDNKQKDQVDITAIHKASYEEEQEKNSLPDNNTTESVALTMITLTNTHTKNSTINMISSTKSTIIPQPTTTTSIIYSTTTESSAKIQSTLMPTTIVDPSNDNDQQSPLNILNNFQISSNHHLAILSRTERSIRSPPPIPTSIASINSNNNNNSSWAIIPSLVLSSNTRSRSSRSSSAVGGGGVMVRRSSDMSVMKSKRLNNSRNLLHKNNLDRNERSTVSHLSGPSRKIQLYIKNRFIQLLPDGTVNGTQDEQCDYTILQRSTVEVGRIKIQGVATCLYLCMDPCGAVYGSKEFTDDCVFNESMEQHNYNTYSSTYNSNTRRKYYLALNRHGEPRKLQIPPSRSLGKLATYTNAIPETVPQERVEQLIAKNFGANRVKHGIRQLCDTGKPLIELIDSKNFKARPKCNPNNSFNNSNSKSTLSRNLDKDNNNNNNNDSLGNNNHHQHHQHSSSSSGQVLNNVPVANDKTSLSSNSRSSSSSSNSNAETNRDSSSSPSSISISQNNGHISNSSSNSKQASSSNNNPSDSLTATGGNSSHRGGKKSGKKRKCRRFENEEQHNCTTPLNRPTSFIRRGNHLGPLRQQKCQNLLVQQQQAGVVDIILPPMCTKKGGSKKQQGNNHRRGQGKNGLVGEGPNNRRGKKIKNRGGGGGEGGSSAKPAAKNTANNGGSKKKQKNPKKGGLHNSNNSHNRKSNNRKPSTTTTTEKINATAVLEISSTSTLKPKSWETTSLMPSTTLYDNYDPHAEATSDRGEREQRNVRYSNSMEEYLEQSSEDTSAGEDTEDDENDMDINDDTNEEDNSYEDDLYAVPSSSHHPHTAAGGSSHTPLTAGSDDFMYYDQPDSAGISKNSIPSFPSHGNSSEEIDLFPGDGQDGPLRVQLSLW